MFSEIVEDGVRWSDGTVLRADVILWCTGFRSSLDHLAPLMLREPGGITMIGTLATQAAKDPGFIWSATAPQHQPSARIAPAQPRQRS
jgi:hypothetical protein